MLTHAVLNLVMSPPPNGEFFIKLQCETKMLHKSMHKSVHVNQRHVQGHAAVRQPRRLCKAISHPGMIEQFGKAPPPHLVLCINF
jgi:hypothetical protein